jgi:hypothetical protein
LKGREGMHKYGIIIDLLNMIHVSNGKSSTYGESIGGVLGFLKQIQALDNIFEECKGDCYNIFCMAKGAFPRQSRATSQTDLIR